MSAPVIAHDTDLTDPESIVATLLYGEPLALDDPYELYAALRLLAPVYESSREGLWVLTRFPDVLAALRHPGSSMGDELAADPRFDSSLTLQTIASSILFVDDPEAHGRQRRLVRQAFTRRTVADMQPSMEALATQLLDRCAEQGTFDFMGDYANRVPVAVICDMLGIPHEDIPTFAEWNYLITTVTGAVITDEHMAKVDQATAKVNEYLGALLDERTKEPRDDLLSALIEARDGSDQLSKEETLSMAHLLLVAGSDTTAAFLGAAMAALLKNPAQLALLRGNRDLMTPAIEELMRYDAPVHFGIMRVMREPLVLESAEIPVGARVWTIFAAANRDPGKYPDPNRLDLERPDVRHIGFGQGMHMCLGAMLARLESGIALNAVLDRFPSLELVEPRVPWLNHGNLRAIAHLNVAAGS
jgi:cytochrome P450